MQQKKKKNIIQRPPTDSWVVSYMDKRETNDSEYYHEDVAYDVSRLEDKYQADEQYPEISARKQLKQTR